MNFKDLKNKVLGKQKEDAAAAPKEEKSAESAGFFKSPEEIIDSFLHSKSKWSAAYNPKAVIDTITRYAKKAGATTVYYVLLLYYSLMSDKLSGIEKALAVAALGYFISPLDIIPDFIPGGLLDDTVILFYGIDKLGEGIDNQSKSTAKDQLGRWFNDTEIFDISKDQVKTATKIKQNLKTPIKLLKSFVGK